MPVVVLSQTFPARPSSFPEIRNFIQRSLADSPIPDEGSREIQLAVSDAVLEAAGTEKGMVHVALRIFPEHVEFDILRTANSPSDAVSRPLPETSFAAWMQDVLRREGLSQEAAARQLGVSVKTVNRGVGGATEPRMRDLRKIRELFGGAPIG